jgi:hypothetical protein
MILGEIIAQALRLTAESKLSWAKGQESNYVCSCGPDGPTFSIVRSPEEQLYLFKVLNADGYVRGQLCGTTEDLKRLYERAAAQYQHTRDVESQEQDKAYLKYTLGILKVF